uniref:Uncharacterized protein n=2 Tax=Chrysotila carterae TaxID=13221 RepID=A0A7S4BPN4_CHRCT
MATDTEVLMLGVLLVARAPGPELQEWIDTVLREEQEYLRLGAEAWVMPAKQAAWRPKGLVHMLVARCLTQELDVLEAAACVMHAGVRQGQVAWQLPASVLSAHIAQLKAGRFTGPKRLGSKREGSPRLACELVRVAQLLRRSGKELLREFASIYEARGQAQALTMAEVASAHAAEKLKLEAEVATLTVKEKRAAGFARICKARSKSRVKRLSAKAKQKLKENRQKGKAMLKAMRKEAKAKAASSRSELGGQSVSKSDSKLVKMRKQRDLARARARGASKRLAKADACSMKRLERARKAEAELKEVRAELDDLQAKCRREQQKAAGEQQRAAEALSRQDAMPALHSSRTQSRGGLELPFALRVLVFGQLARLTPPRAIGPNIAAVVRCIAPWHRCSEPTYDITLKLRSEMSIVGEMLAARRVAELKRIISFGFDETTKYQVGSLSTNVQGETVEGKPSTLCCAARSSLPVAPPSMSLRRLKQSCSRAAASICGAGSTPSTRCKLAPPRLQYEQARVRARSRSRGLLGRS